MLSMAYIFPIFRYVARVDARYHYENYEIFRFIKKLKFLVERKMIFFLIFDQNIDRGGGSNE